MYAITRYLKNCTMTKTFIKLDNVINVPNNKSIIELHTIAEKNLLI